MSRFGNLFNQKPSPAPTPAPEPVVGEAPVVDEVVEEVPEEETHFEDMSKRELEAYGREHGIELDRRHSHKKLVEELKEHLSNS
jgi:hypothetical protein